MRRKLLGSRHGLAVAFLGAGATALALLACAVRPAVPGPALVAMVDAAPEDVSFDASSLVDGPNDPRTGDLLAIVEHAHASNGFEGVVVVMRGETTLYRGAIGLAERAHSVPHAVDEIVRLGAVTKLVTSVLVMQEIEGNQLTLDTTLATALPSVPQSKQHISIRQLLQHTSGLPDRDQDFALLGRVLERATGQRYDQLVLERIARPLGLRSFRIVTPQLPDPSPVRGYLADGTLEPVFDLAALGASGALVGTIDDLAAWGRALVEHRLLTGVSTTILFRAPPAYSPGSRQDPARTAEALGCSSYRVETPPSAQPVTVVERQGAIGGMRSLLLLAPAHDIVIAISANTEKAELFQTWARKGLPYELLLVATRDAY